MGEGGARWIAGGLGRGLEFGEFLFGHWDACIIISTRIIRQLI